MKTTTNEMASLVEGAESAAAAMGITVAAYLEENLEAALVWWRMQTGAERKRAWGGVMLVVKMMQATM